MPRLTQSICVNQAADALLSGELDIAPSVLNSSGGIASPGSEATTVSGTVGGDSTEQHLLEATTSVILADGTHVPWPDAESSYRHGDAATCASRGKAIPRCVCEPASLSWCSFWGYQAVRAYVAWAVDVRLHECKVQTAAIAAGLNSVVPGPALRWFAW